MLSVVRSGLQTYALFFLFTPPIRLISRGYPCLRSNMAFGYGNIMIEKLTQDALIIEATIDPHWHHGALCSAYRTLGAC